MELEKKMLRFNEIMSQQNPEVKKFLREVDFYQILRMKGSVTITNPNLLASFYKREFEKPEHLAHKTLLAEAKHENYVGGFWMMFVEDDLDGIIYWYSWVHHFILKYPNLPYTRLEFKQLEGNEVMILVANEDISRQEDVELILHHCIEANNSIVGKTFGIKHDKLFYKPEYYSDSDVMYDKASPIKSYIYSTTADAISPIKAEPGVKRNLAKFFNNY